MSQHYPSRVAPIHAIARGPSHGSSAPVPVVLVLEDQADEGAELTGVLKLSGYQVIETDNGKDAVKRALYGRPDLLLMDLNVPLLYQMTAARQIVKNARLDKVPVVIATRDEVIDTATIMELGVRRNGYVIRLSDYQQLERLLDYLLNQKARTATAASR